MDINIHMYIYIYIYMDINIHMYIYPMGGGPVLPAPRFFCRIPVPVVVTHWFGGRQRPRLFARGKKGDSMGGDREFGRASWSLRQSSSWVFDLRSPPSCWPAGW